LDHGLVVFVISTTGQGDIPQNALAFWKSLLRKKLPPTCLAEVRFTAFGVGDSTYPKYAMRPSTCARAVLTPRRFNWAVRKFRKRLIQLGGQEFYQYAEADERDAEGYTTSPSTLT